MLPPGVESRSALIFGPHAAESVEHDGDGLTGKWVLKTVSWQLTELSSGDDWSVKLSSLPLRLPCGCLTVILAPRSVSV